RALGQLRPETRMWAVVRRDGAIQMLEAELPKVRLAPSRDPEFLSPLESELSRQHLESAKSRKEEAIRALVTPRLDVAAGQRTWIRFHAGLPATLKTGDVVEGVVSTGLAADGNLDYLAIAPNSQVWAEAVEASDVDGVRSIRLHVFKLKLRGGHAYPVSARVVDLTGDRTLTQLSSGGTAVTADPGGLGPGLRMQIEFLKPLSLFEPPAYFRAGPGVWFKQRGAEKTLEVSHVIAGRSAERAGVQVGDVVLNVGGTAASKLDFMEALDRLYGAPGTSVSLRVQRGKDVVPGLMDLVRGVRYAKGKKDEAVPVPAPFKP
ncbi:MAG: PDZ domain-containing protein, partial [Elusimicrobia bacterium]|nr:PDZ domain-containing protein [Elusimicrobiota bacterium]